MWVVFQELIRLVVAGVVGGLIAAFINLRVFRWQLRYQDELKKRDVLQDILSICPTISQSVYSNWVINGESDEHRQERLQLLHIQIARAKALFIDGDEVTRSLTTLNNLVGAEASRLTQSGVEVPSRTIADIEEVCKKNIRKMNIKLYGSKGGA